MGFIKWHGETEDHYDDVVEFALENAKMEEENFGSQMKKKADAEFFKVPELAMLKTKDVLKLLVREKKIMDVIYEKLLEEAGFLMAVIEEQFYKDFWFYIIGAFLEQSNLDEERITKIFTVFVENIFKVNNQTPIKEHFYKNKKNKTYQKYFEESFVLNSGSNTVFWQWIGYLDEKTGSGIQGSKFVGLYFKFIMHFAFYLNQIMPNQGIGKKLPEKNNINKTIIMNSMKMNQTLAIHKAINNPLYVKTVDINDKPILISIEQKQEIQRKKYITLLKYAKIILGSYLELEEDEEDMVTAGQLYSNIRDKKISIEKIFSIYPSEAVEILENGKIPVLSAEEVKLQIRDGEVLHYMESGILYLPNNEEFQMDRGALYITNQRILFVTGSKTYEILLKQLAKAVLYDAMPEILEIQGIDKVLFVQTAAVEQTYAFLKIIANSIESEDIIDKTEKLSLDYFKNADMNTYICGLKTLSETDMPDDMHQNMILMIGALEKYNAALEKYPSYSQQAERFMDYYIPEVIKLVFDFQEYEKAGISEQKINPVHSKIKASIYKVTSAATQGLDEIYKSATMNTVARAEALREILGQDGFVDPDHKMQ